MTFPSSCVQGKFSYATGDDSTTNASSGTSLLDISGSDFSILDTSKLRSYLTQSLTACRQHTLNLTENLTHEQLKKQAHPDFSPVGWHLGHIAYTESFWILQEMAGQSNAVPQYEKLFAADGLPKAERENLPDLLEILDYLNKVRDHTLQYLKKNDPTDQATLWHWLLQHESQHAETIAIVMALHQLKSTINPPKLSLSSHPKNQCEDRRQRHRVCSLTSGMAQDASQDMAHIPQGTFVQGSDAIAAIDNERPAHTVALGDYWIDRHPVTYGQYQRFVAAGGYRQRQWWSDAGWKWVQSSQVEVPLYEPRLQSVYGSISREANTTTDELHEQPVCGVSWYEADAYARFAGKRLPTEAEWAKAAQKNKIENALSGVWEWTDTWFEAYPGFRPFPYVGYSQIYFDQAHRVLRGGSWATPQWALRKSFRNWYHPYRREIFAGFRCAV